MSDPPKGGLSPERLQLVGRIAVAHSLLEMVTMMLLARLINEQPTRGIALTGGDPLRLQLDRILRLLKEQRDDVDADLRRDIEGWVGDVERVKDERNRILHSIWVGGAEEEPSLRIRFTKGRGQFDERSDDELGQVAEALELLTNGGNELFVRLAKLDTEEPLEVDLDDVLGEE